MIEFEYDPNKSQSNLSKHGIDFEAAQALWDDQRRVELTARSDIEPRFLIIGKIQGQLLDCNYYLLGNKSSYYFCTPLSR